MFAFMASKKKSAGKKSSGKKSSARQRTEREAEKKTAAQKAKKSKSKKNKASGSSTALGPSDPTPCFEDARDESTLPLFVVHEADFADWLNSAPSSISAWLSAREFRGRAGACAMVPGLDGPAGAVVVTGSAPCLWDFSNLPRALPAGSYEVEPELEKEMADALALGWALGSYRFERYKKKKRSQLPRLVWPEAAEPAIVAIAQGIYLARDLINTPAADMGPRQLANTARTLADRHGAKYSCIEGDQLVQKNYPMVHAVGRAASESPRLVELTWGKSKDPKLTLVGKGVCFDTGGLDLKPAQYMKLMKKDMGGAACVLGLAHTIMEYKLPVRLRVLVPAVENAIGGNAMRPLDVLTSRQGMTVEVGDTDAEGRLILADALAEAESEDPDLVIDAATLTGAARVALGTGMPAIFCTRGETWQQLEQAAESTFDPLWRLPLHEPYRRQLDSKIADICNIGSEPYGGAIVAALFLREFVSKKRDWVHMDTMGYNTSSLPGRPLGGEAMGLRALFSMLQQRYAST